jgi:chromosome segregation ATPase
MADERWHDAVKKVAEVSNRERFEKLKESRAKYKEEAARQRAEAEAAASRCETLERQLQMLVAQVESSAASEAEASASARDDAADVAPLESALAKANEEVRRLQDVCASRSVELAKAQLDASEARKRAKKADADGAGGGEGCATGADASATFMYGLLVGAGVVAFAGYAAMTYAIRR